MAIKHSITLSTTEPNNEVGVIKIRQADEQTQILDVQITADGVPMSFVGYQPFFCAKLGQTAGLGIVEQKITGTMNPANGTLEYVMRQEDWQKVGRQIGYFAFRKMKNDHEWTEQFTTRDFTYNVIPSVTGEIREVKKDGSTYVWTIENMLRLFKEYIATGKVEWENYKNDERTIWENYRLAEKINWDDYKLREKNEWKNYKDDEKAVWEKFVEDNREFLETADPGGKIILELLGARGGAQTLGERLDGEKAEVSAQLAQIVTNANSLGADPSNLDNTTFIQSALNKKGLVTITKPGTYLTGRLLIDDDTKFKLSDGVKLRLKDGTNHYLIVNRGHIEGYINKNITLDGGEFDFNGDGNPNSGGYLLEDPQSWSAIGILFNGVKNLTIKNVEKVGGASKYCYLITNIEGFYADNIEFDNDSDGLHFQPPFKNAEISNIRGYCEDDTLSFTAGDYKRYSLGNYGDFENVEITNIHGGKKDGVYTDQFVKLVGSGLDGKSVFKNFTISNLSGGCSIAPVSILREDTVDGNTALTNTRIENIVIENVNVDLQDPSTQFYFLCGASGGDLTIKNFNVKHGSKYFYFYKCDIDNVTIDGVYNYDYPSEPVTYFEWFFRSDKGRIKKINLRNINVKLNTTSTPVSYFVSQVGDGYADISFENSNIEANNTRFYGVIGTPTLETALKINNTKLNVKDFLMAVNLPLDVFVTHSIIVPVERGIYMNVGANVNLESINSAINNIKVETTSPATTLIRLNGNGINLVSRMSVINNMRQGDMVNSTDPTEPLGQGLMAYNGQIWSKARFAPYSVTQNVSIGTVTAFTTKEVALVITEYVSAVNKEVSATPNFVLPNGIIYTAYNRDSGRIRLRVANVTNADIVVPDGDWFFTER